MDRFQKRAIYVKGEKWLVKMNGNVIEPLAYRMCPQNIDEVIGQKHLVGDERIVRKMVESKVLSSMLFFGPPGVGKTSLANAIAGSTEAVFRKLNAAVDTKSDLQAIVEETRLTGKIILLIDEVHRLDKTKQDFLLPHLEKGVIVLIGASTENPYFSLTPALRSRLQIFELFPLTKEEIGQALRKALSDTKCGLGNFSIKIEDQALNFLAGATNGDLRSALNAIELATISKSANDSSEIELNLSVIEEILQKRSLAHDKNGDGHYNTISALQKSIRGSDVDAALFYAARLIEAGELKILMRRLLVVAYEDVGLANPGAAQRTVAAVQAAEKLGLPEARIPLANVVIDLSLSPKSNSAYLAIDAALKEVRKGETYKIPEILQNKHYQGSQPFKEKINYKYPHDYPDNWVNQKYLPANLLGKHFYEAKQSGKYEQALSQRRQQIFEWKKKK